MSTTGVVGMIGGRPKLIVGAGNPEASKYGRMWERPEYRAVAPGEGLAQVFLNHAKPRRGAEVIDFGCGTGRGALMMAILGNVKVTMIDFVRNSLDPEIKNALTTQADVLRFIKADLEKPIPVMAEYGFCTDVMEHIPPNKVDVVLNNILKASQHVFFAIATSEDVCGKLINESLHLSIHSYDWWLEKFSDRACRIHWAKEEKGVCLFYLTAWMDGQEVVDSGRVNSTDEQIRKNVRENCSNGWVPISPHIENEFEVMILGGGPSVDYFEEDIKRKRADGVKLITLNGAYNWALDHGLTPSAQIIVDSRSFNARFTKPVVDDCKYILASQCDPAVFEGLPKDRTFIFHTGTEMIKDLLDELYGKNWWCVNSVPGGTTVLLRAIPLMRILGYKRFHLYGCDSCLFSDSKSKSHLIHHAYGQPENDNGYVVSARVTGGRVFQCNPWMVAQAQELMTLIRVIGDEIELEIYGDGLLKHLLDTGARIEDETLAETNKAVLQLNEGGQ